MDPPGDPDYLQFLMSEGGEYQSLSLTSSPYMRNALGRLDSEFEMTNLLLASRLSQVACVPFKLKYTSHQSIHRSINLRISLPYMFETIASCNYPTHYFLPGASDASLPNVAITSLSSPPYWTSQSSSLVQ